MGTSRKFSPFCFTVNLVILTSKLSLSPKKSCDKEKSDRNDLLFCWPSRDGPASGIPVVRKNNYVIASLMCPM